MGLGGLPGDHQVPPAHAGHREDQGDQGLPQELQQGGVRSRVHPPHLQAADDLQGPRHQRAPLRAAVLHEEELHEQVREGGGGGGGPRLHLPPGPQLLGEVLGALQRHLRSHLRAGSRQPPLQNIRLQVDQLRHPGRPSRERAEPPQSAEGTLQKQLVPGQELC